MVERMTPEAFKAECKRKGWTGRALAERWSKSEAWISRIGSDPERDLRGKVVTLTAEQYVDRPHDPYDNAKEAIWALKQCGWHAVAEEDEF